MKTKSEPKNYFITRAKTYFIDGHCSHVYFNDAMKDLILVELLKGRKNFPKKLLLHYYRLNVDWPF